MHNALQQHPQSYPILHTQCDFLMSKGKVQWAQKVAQQAVNSAPSEFVTWAKLTETFIELGQFDAALLTLNSCPMFTFNERDLHRMPAPAKTHLPVKKFIADSNLLDDESARDNEVGPALDKFLISRPTLHYCDSPHPVFAEHSPRPIRFSLYWSPKLAGTNCSKPDPQCLSWRKSIACIKRLHRSTSTP